MPRTRSLAWSELKIGIIAVAAIALASMLIVAVGAGAGGLFGGRYELKTRFSNVQGLKSGAVVRVAGVEAPVWSPFVQGLVWRYRDADQST